MSHPPGELDWFNFETRMRSIVLDLLQPSAQKSTETAQQVAELSSAHQEALQRIALLEDLVTEGKGRSEYTQGLFAEVGEIRGKLATAELRAREDGKDLQRTIETLQARQLQLETVDEQHYHSVQALEANLTALARRLEAHQDLLRGEMQKVQLDAFHRVSHVETIASVLSDHISSLSLQLEAVAGHFLPLESSISTLSTAQTQLTQELASLAQAKAEASEVTTLRTLLTSMTQDCKTAVAVLARSHREMETFVDLFVPMQIQCIVSDCFFSIQEPRLLADYSKHEKQRFQRLREDIVFSQGRGLDVLRAAFTVQAGLIDTRRAEFELSIVPESPPKAVLKSASTVETTLLKGQSGYFGGSEQASTAQLQADTLSKFSKLEEELKSLRATQSQTAKVTQEVETLEAYIKTLHEEFDSFTFNSQQSKASHKSDAHNLSVRVGQIEEDHSVLMRETKALGGLLSEVVEFSLIVHALLDQDEEDRKSIQLTGYREQVQDTPKARQRATVLGLDPKCLSCSGGHTGILAAFKIACMTYNPSSLRYRGTVYSRAQLIGTLGDVLKTAWGRAVLSPPFHSRTTQEGPLPTPRRKLVSIKPEAKLALVLTPHRRLASADFTG